MRQETACLLCKAGVALYFSLFFFGRGFQKRKTAQETGWRLGTDQKPGLSWLRQVAGPRAAGVARGEVGDAVDAADGLQVVGGTVAVLVTLGRQVRLKDFVAGTVTHPNEQRPCKRHPHFILGTFFCGL